MSSLPATTLCAALLAGLTFCLLADPGSPVPQAKQVAAPAAPIPNPRIDYPGFLKAATDVETFREKRRLTEDQFIQKTALPGTLVLDARSRDKYALLHIEGAVNLPLTDFTAGELAKVIPDKNTRVLIYCNNNFKNQERAFAAKTISTSLNIYSFNSLYEYGYRNIYELGPLLDVGTTKLKFAGTLSKASAAPADAPREVAPSAPAP